MKRVVFVSVVAVLASIIGSADAASLFVRPTTVVFAPGSSAVSVTVTNRGDAPVTAQLRMFSWDQASNEDELNPTNMIAASPPMTTIAAGQSQTIRLVRTVKDPPVREESYRLLVDEIVDRAAAEAASTIVIQLRYSIPVFVMARARDAAKLSVSAKLGDDGIVFDATNRGKSRAQISNVTVTYADGSSKVIGEGLVGYVLPEKDRRWTLPVSSAPEKPRQLRATVNGQEMQLKL